MKKKTYIIIIGIISVLTIASSFLVINSFLHSPSKKKPNGSEYAIKPLDVSAKYLTNKSISKKNKNVFLDDNATDCINFSFNKEVKKIEVYSLKLDNNTLIADKLLQEYKDIHADDIVNFYAFYSETIPNVKFIIYSKDNEVISFTPEYNGQTGEYKLAKELV
ncbi:MAG: hypothetical protein RR922_05760 [Clostridia bacterium]